MKKIIAFLLVLAIGAGIGGYALHLKKQEEIRLNTTETWYLASENENLEIYNMEDQSAFTIPRGRAVEVFINRENKVGDTLVREFRYQDKVYYLPADTDVFVKTRGECVRETLMYTARPEVVYEEIGSPAIAGSVRENNEAHILGYNNMDDNGHIDYYQVQIGDVTGWLKNDEKHLMKVYEDRSRDSSIYGDTLWWGGRATDVKYYDKDLEPGKDLVTLPGNEMPDVVKALYINAGTIWNADDYIQVAEACGINAMVIDIKDDYVISYNSPTIHKYSPSSGDGYNTIEEFRTQTKKLKDKGYYLIARITVFKDYNYAEDHPENVIKWKGDNYRYGGSRWPSIYSREVWEYNVTLAKEVVTEFGFNEVQFDYMRTPEEVPDDADLHNIYGESQIEGVTNFLRYACDVLHEVGAYVSADVFGEVSGGYITGYGQYWPAVSNAVDVISGMPYPDHFGQGYYGIPVPWHDPYALMYNWGLDAAKQQAETYTPARVRTWIQAYDSWVDGTVYDASMVKAQINGLTDAGVNDGYMTWNGGADVYKFWNLRSAFE